MVTQGAKLNLDPTLILKVDKATRIHGIAKGSDNAIVLDPDGDAHYMELGGTSINAGMELFKQQRGAALEVTQCVIPDPNTVAAAGRIPGCTTNPPVPWNHRDSVRLFCRHRTAVAGATVSSTLYFLPPVVRNMLGWTAWNGHASTY